eukprot:g10324.t1
MKVAEGQQQHCHALPLAACRAKPDQGLKSKLSATEIVTAYDNLTKSIGDQAKVLGDQAKTFGEQAKTFGEQAKGYTLANTSTAAEAMNRFKKQIASAVDGAPQRRPDVGQLREPGTTTADEEKVGSNEDSQALLQEFEEGGETKDGETEGRDEESVTNAGAKQVNVGGGMVDESAPMLSLGALAAAFKKKPAGGATVTQVQATGDGGNKALPVAAKGQAHSSASKGGHGGGAGGGEGSRSEGDGNAVDGAKILPRTASLVGGRQWAVMASVFDATASVIDETVGDLFT